MTTPTPALVPDLGVAAKRPATPAQLRALAQAMAVRRTCRACGRDAGYCLPRSWSGCLDCTPDP